MSAAARVASVRKMENEKRKTRDRTDKNIKKLFNNLRNNNSCSSFGSAFSNNSVINVDSSGGLKRTRLEENTISINKRKKLDTGNGSFIVINDDSELNTTHPERSPKQPIIQCSTPIPNKDIKVLQNFITPDGKKINENTDSQNLNKDISNLTETINGDSFITIDLTTETAASCSKTPNTVIDLVNTTENQDCTVVSVSQSNLSMSGDSDVTVLNDPKKKVTKQMRRFAHGIAMLDVSEKERLLDLITQNILGGCNVHSRNRGNIEQPTQPTGVEPAEDAYIKEVIVGQTASRNSIGSNIYNPSRDIKNKTGLRMVVIDGSNVAMEHGRGKVFSVKGLRICIDYFIKRGHAVKAFVPRFRCKFGKSSEPRLLDDLERRGLVVYTPSREIQGRTVAAYDDRYIVQCAAEFDGVIVSGDNYRDLLQENPRWRSVIETRVLPFTWVEDMIMFPRDPMGRNGPTLEQFLRHSPPNQN